MIGLARRFEGLYLLSASAPTTTPLIASSQVFLTSATQPSDSVLWHMRLGHLSHSTLSVLHKQVSGIPCIPHSYTCDVCHFAKQKRLSFPVSTSSCNKIFDLVHFDIWGPFGTSSVHGHRYFLTIVDDYSRFTWIYLMHHKSDARTHIKIFFALVETQFSSSIKALCSDNGTEFHMPQFFASKGVIHQKSCVDTPQQNGLVERKHQHILNVARALLFQSNIPLLYWSFLVLHATNIINCLPSPIIQDSTPFERLYGFCPSYSNFKVFGSLCFASTLAHNRSKFAPRARKCVYLGIPPGSKAYTLLDISTNQIFLSHDVTFHEHVFPFKKGTITSLECLWPEPLNHPSSLDDFPVSTPSSPPAPDPSLPQPSAVPLSCSSIAPASPLSQLSASHPSSSLRRSTRSRHPPSYLQQYHCASISSANQSSSKEDLRYPLSSVLSYSSLSPTYLSFVNQVTLSPDPRSYKQAVKSLV